MVQSDGNPVHVGEGNGWRPLLDGVLASQLLEVVECVADAILTPVGEAANEASRGEAREASLSGGSAGLAIFFGYLSQDRHQDRYRKPALKLLEDAADAVASVTMKPSLYGGFTGVAWAMSHLEKQLFESGEGDSTDAVDEALKGYTNKPTWRADYDLVSGLVGLGVYALERLPAPKAVSCLEGIIDRLEEAAEQQAEGVTWHTAPNVLPPLQRKRCPRGYYNLGLAHGLPGVIVLLAAACASGIKPRKARALLDGAVAWLLNQKRRPRTGSRFPAWVVPGTRPESCRSAWCYGDPGVAAGLFCAARSVGQPAWEREAIEIARGAATRPPDDAGVADAGLCHGAAGLAHIFNRFYQATGDGAFRRAALYWFERTLALRQPGRGVGGFSALTAHEDGTRYWDDDPGLLMGAAGVGLALLAATNSVEPEWDRMLLLSARRHKGKAGPDSAIRTAERE
jgi:hypothetical protein